METGEQVKAALLAEAEKRGDKWRPGSAGRWPSWAYEMLGVEPPAPATSPAGPAAVSAPDGQTLGGSPTSASIPAPFTTDQIRRTFGGALRLIMKGVGCNDPDITDSELKDWAEQSEPFINQYRQYFGPGVFFTIATLALVSPRVGKRIEKYRARKVAEAEQARVPGMPGAQKPEGV